MAVEREDLMRVLLADRSKLLAYAFSITRDPHMAEDIYQDVSILALSKTEQIESVAKLPAWLRATARFRAMQLMKKQRGRSLTMDQHLLDLLESDWAEFDRIPSHDATDAVRACVEHLSPYARSLVDLRYGQNLTSSQIAARLHRRVGTIYVALTRLHRTLADCIRRRMVENV